MMDIRPVIFNQLGDCILNCIMHNCINSLGSKYTGKVSENLLKRHIALSTIPSSYHQLDTGYSSSKMKQPKLQ